jgi:hypothetical protein
MDTVIEKARKYIGIWADDGKRLKQMSEQTGRTQVEIVHAALVAYERQLATEKEDKDAC